MSEIIPVSARARSGGIDKQTHLGWRQIFNGRWSCKWAHLQDQYLREIGNKDPKYTGTTWLTTMITTVWKQFFEVWSERNATIHGNTHTTRQEALRRKITREIHQWYHRQDQLLQTDRTDILEAKYGPTIETADIQICLLYTSPSPRDLSTSRMPSSA